MVLFCLLAGFRLAVVGANAAHLRISNQQRVAIDTVEMLVVVVANMTAWHSPVPVTVLLFLMGAFLGLAILANNVSVMAAVPASASAVTDGMLNVAHALGAALGVAVTAMGLYLAELHHWAGPRVVLSALTMCALALAATTLRPPLASGRRVEDCTR